MNLEEQLPSMKVALEKLCKENAEKNAKIKHQNEQIADWIKKFEKRPLEACNKGSQSKECDKESNRNEDFDKQHKLKKDSSLCSSSIDPIQILLADAVKLQLREGSFRTHHYSKPYLKRIDALKMPLGYQPPNLINLMAKRIQSSI